MKILAIDTSTKYLSVAILENNRPLAAFNDRSELKHSALLIPAIDEVLESSNLRLRQLDAIALSIGPGSFTGLRIGVATCKGVNLATGIPIAVVPTLDVIAYNFIDEKEEMLCPLIDAKKGKVYTCLYRRTGPELKRLTEYMLVGIETLLKSIRRPALVFGDGVKSFGNCCKKNPFIRISTKEWYPKAEIVARVGLAKALKKQFVNPDKLVPMYLHSRYCQVKRYHKK